MTYRTISGVIFVIVAVLQAIRAVMGIPVRIGATELPVWPSLLAAVVAAALGFWAFCGGL
ncbi:MAG: hypothetical protein ACJ8KU_06605 [Chthoniobacterales bacterium]